MEKLDGHKKMEGIKKMEGSCGRKGLLFGSANPQAVASGISRN